MFGSILVIAIIGVLAFFGVRATVREAKGQGCEGCGGKSSGSCASCTAANKMVCDMEHAFDDCPRNQAGMRG